MLGYAGIVSLGHAAFFGFGAYVRRHPGQVRHHQGAGAGAARVGHRRDGARLRHQLPGAARLGPHAPDGDARRRAGAARDRQPPRDHRRRRRPAGRRDGADPRPLPVRYLRQDRLRLQPDRAVHPVPDRAAHRAFAVRPLAALGEGQSAARLRGRHPRQRPARRDLHHRGRHGGDRGRAADPDDAVRLALGARLRALGRRAADPDHRRRRLSLRRPDRRGAVQAGAGLSRQRHAAILAVLARPRAGDDDPVRARLRRRDGGADLRDLHGREAAVHAEHRFHHRGGGNARHRAAAYSEMDVRHHRARGRRADQAEGAVRAQGERPCPRCSRPRA